MGPMEQHSYATYASTLSCTCNQLPSRSCCCAMQERIEALRGQLSGRLESAVLNCCAFTSSAAAQQLLESNLVKRGHR